MAEDIITDGKNINLNELAAKIRHEFGKIDAADHEIKAVGHRGIGHAIAAGRYFFLVQQQIGRGFRRWLAAHGFKHSTAYNYMLLAEHAETVHRDGHSSIRAALRELRAKLGPSKRSDKPKQTHESPLTKAAWTKATIDEQRRFLDSVGADSLCKALSLSLRAELRRRVSGQQAAQTSALAETIAAGLRQVLSLQKTSKVKNMAAMGIASALNALNNKLEAAGLDLNNVAVVIDPNATQKKAA
jgi:hypothetical protein